MVGTDATARCDAALVFAADESRLRRARLVIVMSFTGPVDPDIDDFETSRDVLVHEHKRRVIAALGRALALSTADLPDHEIVCDDRGVADLLRDTSVGAEMLVLGRHQGHLLDTLLHGPSATGDLVRHSRVPVVVVPHHDREHSSEQDAHDFAAQTGSSATGS
ncbi:universal stress protein [Allobranchiibius sp. GilTou73]|uniref:universal stress protein n=1 Tax=unclassified Allobranchiibius TaxID=2649857 RepID=UPI001AA17037|nr:universal stress protein [Allobranchiibius sp. GilTou73]MBO1766723.1 universal stress protein [Allobranchiibius sp. GilTou38]UIJ33736.1 universal stress protein [Allobranchiibius sp. GilTou73]